MEINSCALAKLSLEAFDKNVTPAVDYTIKIPNHVLELVFENLAVQDCFRAPSRVCRRWNSLIRTSGRIWKHFCVKRNVYALKGCPLFQRNSVASKNLESLAVMPRAGNWKFLFDWLREAECRKIKHLEFRYPFDPADQYIMPFVCWLGDTVNTLNICGPVPFNADIVLPIILSSCKNLTELHIYDTSRLHLSSETLDQLQVDALKLKRLTLKLYDTHLRRVCNFLLDHCPLLEEIHFIDCSFYEDAYDISIFHRFPRLRSYTLELQSGDIQVEQWRGLSSSCHQEWKAMSICLRTVLHGNDLLPILKHCSDIETLELALDISKPNLAFDGEPTSHPVLTLIPRYFHKLRHLVLYEETALVLNIRGMILLLKDPHTAPLEMLTLAGFREEVACSWLYYCISPVINLPSVKSLGLKKSSAFTSAHIYALHDLAIENLYLTEMRIGNDDDWIKALEAWNKLTSIHFENCTGVTQGFIVRLLSGCSSINRLYVEPSYFLDNATRNWAQAKLSARGGSFAAF